MDLFARLLAATVVADLGAGLGTAVGAAAPRRLHLMVWIAAGAMLAVLLFDVLPESYHAVGAAFLTAALLSGGLLLWIVGNKIFNVCPACAITQVHNHSELQVGKGIWLMLIALGIHGFLDGVGLVTQIGGRQDLGLLLAISLHKLPEGLALTLLLTGAGYSRRRSFALAVGIEALTIVGGIVGNMALRGVGDFWPGLVAAHIAGGFLYLISTTAFTARKDSAVGQRPVLFCAGGLSFVVIAIFLLTLASQ